MRELSDPLTEEDKAWMRNRNMEIPETAGEPFDDVPDDYDDWTIPKLKQELGDRSLPVSGNKEELVERLVEDDESQ